MLSWHQALNLLRTYRLTERRIQHSVAVATFAFDMARRLRSRRPDLPVDPRKVKIAALLHDIGRGHEGDHELNSIEILRREGLPELADIVSHGSIYEIMKLRGHDRPDLLPHSLENKIVAYADARVRLAPVSLQQRVDDLISRRSGDTEKVESAKMARERFEEMERELRELL
jgi:putative nucleotidyltransferase with HDIG domain